MTPAQAVRLSADERRDAVIAAAIIEFGARGYAGTSTQAIARRVGVSQPYLFQLYGTKEELFIAAVRACFGETIAAFEESGTRAKAEGADTTGILKAMGQTYMSMIEDRDRLRLQLQAYAACAEPAIQSAVRSEWTTMYERVARISGADDAQLHQWFAHGMLCNVAAAIGTDLSDAIRLKLAIPEPVVEGGARLQR